MKIVDANNCNINVCDLVTLSKALSDNYRLDINCGHVELCGFTEYYFSEKKKCNPKPPLVLGECKPSVKFLDSSFVCSLVEEGIKNIIRFKDYICNVLDTDILYSIKADNLICQLIEITTTTTTVLPTTTTTLPVTTSTTTTPPTTTSTTTTQRIEIIKAMFEAYLCQLIEMDITTTTTTLVDWRTTTSTTTIPLPTTTSTTTTTVDPSLPTTTVDPNVTTTSTTEAVTTTTTTIQITTSTTTEAPCNISINVIVNSSVPPEFELISASLVKNDDPDQYELTIQYKVWMSITFAECQSATIEFAIYKEDGTYLTTVSHNFTTASPNVWNKPVETITDLFIFDPFLFNLNVVNGTGDGDYKEGLVVNINATIPEGYYLVNWTDPDNILSDINIANPTVTMKNKDSIVTANCLSYYILTVNNGTINEI